MPKQSAADEAAQAIAQFRKIPGTQCVTCGIFKKDGHAGSVANQIHEQGGGATVISRYLVSRGHRIGVHGVSLHFQNGHAK